MIPCHGICLPFWCVGFNVPNLLRAYHHHHHHHHFSCWTTSCKVWDDEIQPFKPCGIKDQPQLVERIRKKRRADSGALMFWEKRKPVRLHLKCTPPMQAFQWSPDASRWAWRVWTPLFNRQPWRFQTWIFRKLVVVVFHDLVGEASARGCQGQHGMLTHFL